MLVLEDVQETRDVYVISIVCENKRTQCSQLYLQEQGLFPSKEDQGPPVFE
jgi:hypothetical protein